MKSVCVCLSDRLTVCVHVSWASNNRLTVLSLFGLCVSVCLIVSVFTFHGLALTDSQFFAFSGYVCGCPSGCLFVSVFMFHRPAITQFLAFFYWAHTLKGDHGPVLIKNPIPWNTEVSPCGSFPGFIWNTRGISEYAKRVLTTIKTLVYATCLFNLQHIFYWVCSMC